MRFDLHSLKFIWHLSQVNILCPPPPPHRRYSKLTRSSALKVSIKHDVYNMIKKSSLEIQAMFVVP